MDSSPEDTFVTAIESFPQSSNPTIVRSESSIHEGERVIYRPAQQLPFELQEHVKIYFEEELFPQCLALLSSIISSGTHLHTPSDDSDDTGHLQPVLIPPASYLAALATISVHPIITTRARTAEQRTAADDALRLLRLLLSQAGPLNAPFSTAFTFRSAELRSRSRNFFSRRRVDGADDTVDSPLKDDVSIKSGFAQEKSLWNRAEDFWAVAGWAFNCSIKHKKRWARWKLWLEMMCEVLEKDWEARLADARESNGGGRVFDDDGLANSLVMRYIASSNESRTGRRRIMRGLFADGSDKSLSEFGEVFRNELKERKKTDEELKKTQKINIEDGDFGDYLDDEEDHSMEDAPEPKSTRRVAAQKGGAAGPRDSTSDEDGDSDPDGIAADPDEVEGATSFGGVDAVNLRLRIVSLLITVAYHMPTSFTSLDDFFDLVAEFVRPLALPLFSLVISPLFSKLDYRLQISLSAVILKPMISAKAPTYDEDRFTQADFERLLPYPANTTKPSDNAKVSLLIENLLSLIMSYVGFSDTSEIKEMAMEGIKARERQAALRKSSEQKRMEFEYESMVLETSGRRIMALIKVLD